MNRTELGYVFRDRKRKREATEMLERWINLLRLYLAILWP